MEPNPDVKGILAECDELAAEAGLHFVEVQTLLAMFMKRLLLCAEGLSFSCDIGFPYYRGNGFILERTVRIYLDAEDNMFVEAVSGMCYGWDELSVNVQDLFCSHIHLALQSELLSRQFSRN